MPLSSTQYLILEILDNQSEGYLCSEYSSAFISVGLEDHLNIRQELVNLQNDGLVEYYTDEEETTVVKVEKDEKGKARVRNGLYTPLLDENGDFQTEVITNVVDEGWIITEAGRTALTS